MSCAGKQDERLKSPLLIALGRKISVSRALGGPNETRSG